MRRNLILQCGATVIALMCAPLAQAATIDLTTAGSSGTSDGATFIQGGTLSGTGVFPAFVQIGGNDPIHDAYNTTVNNVLDNGSSSTFNHEIQVSDLSIYYVGNVPYYSFFLDINESNGTGGQGVDADKYLSLDALSIFTGTTANLSTTDVTDPSPLGTLRYNMVTATDVFLDYNLNTGSGKADMVLLVPLTNFAGALQTDFVYLYSMFGSFGTGDPAGTAPFGNYGASDGFEEWALGPTSPCSTTCTVTPTTAGLPEPTLLTLLGAGLVAASRRLRQRNKA
jgi:hypothetical protein